VIDKREALIIEEIFIQYGTICTAILMRKLGCNNTHARWIAENIRTKKELDKLTKDIKND